MYTHRKGKTIEDFLKEYRVFACCTKLESAAFYKSIRLEIGRSILNILGLSSIEKVKVTSNYKDNHFCEKGVEIKKSKLLKRNLALFLKSN